MTASGSVSPDDALFASIGRRVAKDWEIFNGTGGVPFLLLDYYPMNLTPEEAAACRRLIAAEGRDD